MNDNKLTVSTVPPTLTSGVSQAFLMSIGDANSSLIRRQLNLLQCLSRHCPLCIIYLYPKSFNMAGHFVCTACSKVVDGRTEPKLPTSWGAHIPSSRWTQETLRIHQETTSRHFSMKVFTWEKRINEICAHQHNARMGRFSVAWVVAFQRTLWFKRTRAE